MPSRRASLMAFTLIELSIVLAILSLLIAGIMSVVSQTTRRTAMMEAKRKMDVIEAELLNFRRRNGRLPCPSNSCTTIDNRYFGVEGTPTGDCTNGSTYSNNSTYTH